MGIFRPVHKSDMLSLVLCWCYLQVQVSLQLMEHLGSGEVLFLIMGMVEAGHPSGHCRRWMCFYKGADGDGFIWENESQQHWSKEFWAFDLRSLNLFPSPHTAMVEWYVVRRERQTILARREFWFLLQLQDDTCTPWYLYTIYFFVSPRGAL